MFFKVLESRQQIPSRDVGRAYLVMDRWDDWDEFQTQFELIVFSNDGQRFSPGLVKIGHFGLLPGSRTAENAAGVRSPMLHPDFNLLDEGYFSLGQGENYYETLNLLSSDLRQAVLDNLRDCALDLTLFNLALNEPVMQRSLLRDISIQNVHHRLHRLARGDASPTEFSFEFQLNQPPKSTIGRQNLSFQVTPFSHPPTNVHVITGRNGSGKTRCLQAMVRAANSENSSDAVGQFHQLVPNASEWSFAGLLFVSFSAFDNFIPIQPTRAGLLTTIIGLRDVNDTLGFGSVKSPEDLAKDFAESFEQCRFGLRAKRWQLAIEMLENDPLFAEMSLGDLLQLSDDEVRMASQTIFRQLSSGHAFVLLVVTRIVERVDERTLLIMEEPESHLHPPLLATFVRAVANLVTQRNGVAILSTHSPVVLQEVPRSCVWNLRRTGSVCVAERPSIETFGENLGVITREIFGLEVSTAGFHRILLDAVVLERLGYEEILQRFDNQLGAEAKAIVRGLIANRDLQDHSK